jgi:hypothetical protein
MAKLHNNFLAGLAFIKESSTTLAGKTAVGGQKINGGWLFLLFPDIITGLFVSITSR